MLQSHEVTFAKTSPFFTFGSLSEKTQFVWWLFHGYGQLAEYFYKKFECLNPESHFFILPEGTSKFYTEGLTGRVGASWLTKQNRQQEIADSLAYLKQVANQVALPTNKPLIINILGFSQGATMAARWALSQALHFDSLTLWAGNFPSETEPAQLQSILANKQVFFVYGLQDKFIESGMIQKQQHFFEQQNIPIQTLAFEGKHELNEVVIKQLAQQIAQHHQL